MAGAWWAGPVLLAIASVVLAAVIPRLSMPRRLLLVALATVLPLASSPVNLMTFHDVAQDRVVEGRDEARTRGAIGQSVEWLLATYGKPDRVVPEREGARWYYDSGPWYVHEFDRLYSLVEDGHVTQVAIDWF